jgi:hypothetical protein
MIKLVKFDEKVPIFQRRLQVLIGALQGRVFRLYTLYHPFFTILQSNFRPLDQPSPKCPAI